jgi:hypothetical protein
MSHKATTPFNNVVSVHQGARMDTPELANTKEWLFCLNLAKTVGGIGVFVALGIEIAADWFADPLREKIEQARELQISELTTEAARLTADAESSRKASAEANARMAEAQARTEILRRASSDAGFRKIVTLWSPSLRKFPETSRFYMAGMIWILSHWEVCCARYWFTLAGLSKQ